MSAEHAKGNTEGARALFNKRIKYRDEALLPQASGYPDGSTSAVTAFMAEKFLYGRVDRDFVPMAMKQTHQKRHLKAISSAQSQEQNMRAMHFVVDAFNAMAQQFAKCAMMGKIDNTDPFLSQLKVYRAFEDPKLAYQQYMSRYIALLKVNANSDPLNQIENFEQFEKVIVESVTLTGISSPVTYPGFVKSRRCPITVSGLVIEVANSDASDDEAKVAQFLKSRNWDFFANAAATYGFMIDMNVPWRLVADIGSSAMLQYAAKYGMDTTDKVLSMCYAPVAPVAASTLDKQLLNMYNKVKPEVILHSEECGGNAVMRQRTPAQYNSRKRLKEELGFERFLSLYCNMRFLEEESMYTENEKHLLIDDTVEMARLRGLSIAIGKFERILNKPFDYSGSLSYYVNYAKLADEQKEADASERDAYEAYGSIPQER
tara:strand:+ start:2036 stop:3328 length:1293 start_codon:yes stop_codon:yes gene_type:complete